MCPGNVVEDAVNAFASTCTFNTEARHHVCTDCAEGHGGDRCEVCVDQWYGTPEDPAVCVCIKAEYYGITLISFIIGASKSDLCLLIE